KTTEKTPIFTEPTRSSLAARVGTSFAAFRAPGPLRRRAGALRRAARELFARRRRRRRPSTLRDAVRGPLRATHFPGTPERRRGGTPARSSTRSCASSIRQPNPKIPVD
ncbi:hypothetical protein U9M48_041854, partial [Paspalum notatum var. saurae]